MQRNKVGAVVSIATALLMVMPTAVVLADQQNQTSSSDGGQGTEVRVTSSQNNENTSGQKQYTAQNGGEQNRTTTTGQSMADEHRGQVATFVQNLLKTADKNQGGVGDQIRAVAKEQGDSETTTTEAVKQIESRGKLKTFLIGTDYKNIGVIRSEIVKTQNRIDK